MSRRFLLVLLLFFLLAAIEKSEGKKRVSIPDELDDVVDDEEDEEWKQWGTEKRNSGLDQDEKPPDFSRMNPDEIQAELMRRHTGPSYGFVKLRLGVSRSREEVPVIAMKWSKVLRTGSVEAKFMAVDQSTIMFTMERGQDILELKEFILSQPEAYEMKIGDQVYRRPGDPPLDQVIETLQGNKITSDSQGSTTDRDNSNDEL
ncbi:uncharacterized protein [Typha latifolia]|uniref:uncharacterized protein n=1 Tax=Typha latifolia TaxID=4733 RepID=UPI003C2E573A